MPCQKSSLQPWLLGAAALLLANAAHAQQILPNGDAISPTATSASLFQPLNPHIAGYPNFTAGQAVSTAISPDGNTLLILTSGYNKLFDTGGNLIPAAANEYVFVYNITNGVPVEQQVLQVPNTYIGIAFAPNGQRFYVSGGVDDDIHTYAYANSSWLEQGKPIPLGHYAGIGQQNPLLQGGIGFRVKPATAGLAVTANGATLAAANFYNDSISLVDLASGAVTEVQLRPGLINPADTGKPGGEYPYAIAIKGSDTAYVSSLRDREIDVVRLTGTPGIAARIAVPGNPAKLLLNKAGTLLFVATGNADQITVINTQTNRIAAQIPCLAPPALITSTENYRGADPNSLALSPDEKTLYVTDGGTNAVAVIALDMPRPQVTGLIPTGYAPNAVSIGDNGQYFYAVNGGSPSGANPLNCSANDHEPARGAFCAAGNQYVLQLSKAGFLAAPLPIGAALAATTATVAANDHFASLTSQNDATVMAALHQRIHHIVYIIRESRSYDQILGDLGKGNGNPALTEYGAAITPNAHALANNFVDLDNFYDPGAVSGDGWAWSTAARDPAIGMINLPVNNAGRGLSYDWEGANRNVDVAIPTLAGRQQAEPLYALLPGAANLLPGTGNIASPDSPGGDAQRGFLWDAALRAGLTVRNYGFFEDLTRYARPAAEGGIAELTDPYAAGTQVAFSANPSLLPLTDIYYRGFDNAFPDVYREAEWQREFQDQVADDDMPNLTLLRLMHDHLGNFSTAIDGVNTPETQVADNDYAVGKVIQAIAHSPYANSTLIFVVEDDAQDGPDHVGAQRGEAYVVGPYVKLRNVDSTRYSTVNMLRTIEDILGIGHLSIFDAAQKPMTDVFDLNQKNWTFTATVPASLTTTTLPLTTTP